MRHFAPEQASQKGVAIEQERERLVRQAEARRELDDREIDLRCQEDPLFWLQGHTRTENEKYIEQGLPFRQPLPSKKHFEIIMRYMMKEKRLFIAKSREMMTSWLACGFRIFQDAAPLWLASRVKIKPRTRQDYEQYIRALVPFFGKLPLRAIHLGHFRQYQTERSQSAGPARINHELCLLSQVLRRAGLWASMEEAYEALPLPYWQPPRTMTDDEEQRFFQIASSRTEWELVYCFALLSVNIGASGCEMRGLRIGDVDMLNQRITIRRDSAKNKYRVRRVPLVASAQWAAQRLLEIAASKGASAPHHYLFPFRAKRNQWDATRSMTNSGIKKPWLELRNAAGLEWLTPHCLRHQANTKLYEAGADDMTIMSIMGHQTRQMSEHYSHIREQRKRDALEAACGAGRRQDRSGGELTGVCTPPSSSLQPSARSVKKSFEPRTSRRRLSERESLA